MGRRQPRQPRSRCAHAFRPKYARQDHWLALPVPGVRVQWIEATKLREVVAHLRLEAMRQVGRLQKRLFELHYGFALRIEKGHQDALRRKPVVDGAIELDLRLLHGQATAPRVVFSALQLNQLRISLGRAPNGEQQIETDVELVERSRRLWQCQLLVTVPDMLWVDVLCANNWCANILCAHILRANILGSHSWQPDRAKRNQPCHQTNSSIDMHADQVPLAGR